MDSHSQRTSDEHVCGKQSWQRTHVLCLSLVEAWRDPRVQLLEDHRRRQAKCLFLNQNSATCIGSLHMLDLLIIRENRPQEHSHRQSHHLQSTASTSSSQCKRTREKIGASDFPWPPGVLIVILRPKTLSRGLCWYSELLLPKPRSLFQINDDG